MLKHESSCNQLLDRWNCFETECGQYAFSIVLTVWLCWQQEELCSLRCQIDYLVQQQQQTDVTLSSLQRCLDVIEADSQLTESSADAIRQAKQHISSRLETQSTAGDAELSWMWLQRQSDTQLTDIQVCVCLSRDKW